MKTQKHSDIDRLFAAMSYVWVLFAIPYTIGYRKPFVFRHAKNGLALFIFELLLMAVGMVPVFGWAVAFAGWLFVCVCIVLGIGHALAGQAWKVPMLSRYMHEKRSHRR